MAEHTGIQWTDHTYNPWSGCSKISAGCANCYAANLPPAMRRHAVWGDGGQRVRASASYLDQPHKWNRKAEKDGVRRRVFCASVADVFEARPELDPWREDLLKTIAATPHLDWQLLTKRPEYAAKLLAGRALPPNLWIGTSVENQEAADTRIPHLLKIPAVVRFLSMEPLLGPVDVSRWLSARPCACDAKGDVSPFRTCSETPCAARIGWAIIGGESGNKARPMHPDWARKVRDQCIAAGVPFFFKQWGEWAPADEDTPIPTGARFMDRAEGDVTDRTHLILGENRERPCPADICEAVMVKVGKAAAGNMLDGRQWAQFPEPTDNHPTLFGAPHAR